jgi:DnaJ-class molecular chaperone
VTPLITYTTMTVLFLFYYFLYRRVFAGLVQKTSLPKQTSRQQHSSSRGSDESIHTTILHPAYKLLGVKPTDSMDRIKSAYKTQISKYHPDKVANLGPEIQETAKEQTARLNQAYEHIRSIHKN